MWYPWLFKKTPNGVWNSQGTVRRYMEWLGDQLGIEGQEGWYHLKPTHLQQHCGGTLLLLYSTNIPRLLQETFPEYKWRGWLFNRLPPHYWNQPSNVLDFTEWLKERFHIESTMDLYKLSGRQLRAAGGAVLLDKGWNKLLAEIHPQLSLHVNLWRARVKIQHHLFRVLKKVLSSRPHSRTQLPQKVISPA